MSDPGGSVRAATVSTTTQKFKHMFECRLDVSPVACYKSYRRSIEHPFESLSQKGTIMALAATFPAAGTAAPSTARRQLPSTRRAGVRLTPRGRAVLLLASTAFLLLAVLVSGRFSADAGTSSATPATGVMVVQAGESLWSIAQQIAPAADPREIVILLRELNGLETSTVVAGQSIVVPAGPAAAAL